MIRFKQTFASARERIARLVPFYNAPPHPTRANFYQQPRLSFSSVHSSSSQYVATPILASPPSNRTPNAHRQSAPTPLTAVRRVPATVTLDTHAAHVCKFSHGSGLLVYINGALMSAALVALKVNIAALELVRRLPIDELNAIGVCLAAAFSDAEESVDISWAEVGSDTEREWREAERSWDRFSGGPYKIYEVEEQSEDYSLQRSLRRFEEAVRSRLGQRGESDVAQWLAYRGQRPLSSENPSSAQSDSDYASLLHRKSTGGGYNTAAPGLSDSRSDFSDMELTAIELKAILRAERGPETPSTTTPDSPIELKAIPRPSDSSDKVYIRGPWSPGQGAGPIMSNEEFEALPDYSDVEDDPNW